jgi:hypothetical protein
LVFPLYLTRRGRQVHLLFDGSHALLPYEEGGLGLEGAGLPTLESLCWLVDAHERARGLGVQRNLGPGVNLGWLVPGMRRRKTGPSSARTPRTGSEHEPRKRALEAR